ncbi:uncharacterized protein BO66DRAFT_118046 [Aspergillus aculeatinus CBS 121060]|uniref:Uncharacterized protein n=1 Tax=Aspergillus aculeatinus CBS 121060 TaxID=1448322 RepID=A0ACD1H582_9EURO|nr:hypothetical protein BO66DRAFT_118046 [Aspergillus aculeatinus CBS 121060]RAH68943.1 hypothetical protein BO66DRAFT_118046 [Aspergillus aculeatinus CBS 121060]
MAYQTIFQMTGEGKLRPDPLSTEWFLSLPALPGLCRWNRFLSCSSLSLVLVFAIFFSLQLLVFVLLLLFFFLFFFLSLRFYIIFRTARLFSPPIQIYPPIFRSQLLLRSSPCCFLLILSLYR